MFLTALLVTIAPAVTPMTDAKTVRQQFVELAGKQDRAACLALWRANPSAVLGTIDADLEGSLKVREKSAYPDLRKITEMLDRAMWGAEIAAEAGGHPMILDYASSFVGWNDAERKQFRAGQAAFGRAQKALDAKAADQALAAGNECLQLARPLGDWWGTAMGFDAIAAAQAALGAHDKALEAASVARTIYHDLGLQGDEYIALQTMTTMCQKLGRTARAKVACDAALVLAKKFKDDDGQKRLEQTRVELDAVK
ncbi:MAG: hypothetical protein JNL28_10690 [Planctomycetes bacterium]|nr:hypothetical protein [Planctomycetota bacterium]